MDHKLSAEVKEGPADCIRMDEMTAALKEMKRHKAPGLSGLVKEMIQATGEIGTQWILDLCNGIVKEGSIPEDWKSSVVLPIYTRRDRSRGIRDDVTSGEPEVLSRERTWPPQPVAQPSRATGRPFGTKYDNVDQNKAKKEGPGGARGQTGSTNMAATRLF